MERARKRSTPDWFEQEQHDFFERVRECYLQLAIAEPERFAVIDTSRCLAEVSANIDALADQLIASS
jgi:dTMP kinase